MSLVWDPNLETGIPLIDEQHRSIYAQLDSLMNAMKQGKGKQEIAKVLDFLGNYVQEHFTAEEKEMEKIGYPNLSSHRSQHVVFIHTYERLHQQFETKGAATSVVLSVQREIVDWVIHHIRDVDRQYADYMKKKTRT